MRALRSALALLLAAGLAGCAYGGGGGGYGYQQADAYPGYGYSAGPSIGLGFGSNNYGGYPAYYPSTRTIPTGIARGSGTVRRPAAIPATAISHRRVTARMAAAQCGRGSARQAADLRRQADLQRPAGQRREQWPPAATGRPLRPRTANPLCKDCDS